MLHVLARRSLALVALLTVAAHAATGSLDPQFGGGGTVTTPIPGLSGAEDVVVQGDAIVAAGSSGDNFGVVRYLANGTLDTGFGEEGTGIVSIFIGPPARAEAIGVRSDGLIVAAGGANGFAAAFLDGANGEVIDDGRVTAGTYWGYGLAIAPDDSFVFSGEAGNGRGTCALASFATNGGLVPGFGSGGVKISDIGRCDAVLRLADGKLVVTTNENAAGTNGFGIARFTSTGDLDGTFGTGGVTLAFEDSFAFVRALARTADGKYIAVGQGGSGLSTPKSLVVARFNENGTLDTGFINGGVIVLGIPNTPIALSGDAVVIEPSGNIVVGGTASGPGNVKDGGGPSVFFLMRLLPDGTPDLSFGDDGAGAVITGFGTGSQAELHALALQPDGKLVAAGRSCLAGNCAFALARYVLGPPGPVSTTTTTLPGGGGGGGGCTLPGVDGLRCLCAAGPSPATCAGQTLRAPIGNTFRKACAAVEKGVAAPKPAKSRTQFKRVRTFLKQASAHARRQAKKKKRGIDAACAGSLEVIFASGRTLADGVIASIPK